MIIYEIRNIFRKHSRLCVLDKLTGLSSDELTKVEEKMGVVLPETYKQLMRAFGPEILFELSNENSTICISQLQQEALNVLRESDAPNLKLPDKTFVFFCSWVHFCFFIADGNSDNPFVYYYYYEDEQYNLCGSPQGTLKDWLLHQAEISARPKWA